MKCCGVEQVSKPAKEEAWKSETKELIQLHGIKSRGHDFSTTAKKPPS
jgi:hypothetical protein